MRAARLARPSSGHAPALGGRRSLLAGRARLERAQEPANRARRRPARARRGGRRASSWRRATWSGSSATTSFVDAREFERLVAGRAAGGGRRVCATASCCRDSTRSGSTRPASRTATASATCWSAWPRTPRRPARSRTPIRISRRRVELDPLREDAHRELIRRLIAAGEVAAARVAFDDLARRLRAELHVPPSRETRRLLEAIHAHEALPRRSRRDAPPLPAGARAARAQPVRRPRGLARLAAVPVVRGSARVGPARGDRRRPGIGKTRLASELARAAHADGRGGAARPLSRGAADLLSAVRRGVRSVRRGGLAGGAARPSRHATAASSRGSFPSSPGGSRTSPSRPAATRRASASACSRQPARLLANASRSWPVVLVLEDLHWADKPTPCCSRTWCARSRPSACWSSAPTARRSSASRWSPCSRTCAASGRSSGCGSEAFTAGRSPR